MVYDSRPVAHTVEVPEPPTVMPASVTFKPPASKRKKHAAAKKLDHQRAATRVTST